MALPSIKNRVGMTVTGTPGTGTITLNAADTGYQSFATAYAANANVDILIEEGNAWEIARDCTYTHSGTTVSRGTLEASSTGSAVSFTSAAKVYVINSAQRIQRAILRSQNYINFTNDIDYVKYVSSVSIKVNGGGEAVVNGELLTWTSDLTWSGTSGTAPLAAAGRVYGYMYSNSGTATLEVSTTVPVWDSTNRYYTKTGDTTRRCIWAGYVWATTAAVKRIVPFIALANAQSAELFYEADYVDGSNSFVLGSLNVVAAGTSTSAASFSLPYTAAHATHYWISVKLLATTANADAVATVNPRSWSLSITSASQIPMYTVRSVNPTAGSKTFFGRAWIPITEASTSYYGVQTVTGTASIEIETPGMRIPL